MIWQIRRIYGGTTPTAYHILWQGQRIFTPKARVPDSQTAYPQIIPQFMHRSFDLFGARALPRTGIGQKHFDFGQSGGIKAALQPRLL